MAASLHILFAITPSTSTNPERSWKKNKWGQKNGRRQKAWKSNIAQAQSPFFAAGTGREGQVTLQYYFDIKNPIFFHIESLDFTQNGSIANFHKDCRSAKIKITSQNVFIAVKCGILFSWFIEVFLLIGLSIRTSI